MKNCFIFVPSMVALFHVVETSGIKREAGVIPAQYPLLRFPYSCRTLPLTDNGLGRRGSRDKSEDLPDV